MFGAETVGLVRVQQGRSGYQTELQCYKEVVLNEEAKRIDVKYLHD